LSDETWGEKDLFRGIRPWTCADCAWEGVLVLTVRPLRADEPIEHRSTVVCQNCGKGQFISVQRGEHLEHSETRPKP
jgi:hypothetical protein